MKVSADYICEHGMPSPWATCTECMMLPSSERPEPPAPPPKTRVKKAPPGVMPQAVDDPIPDLVGDRDVSFPVHDFDAHMVGEGNDWLTGGQGFPWGLRHGGWVYLRCDGRLGGRARVKGIGFREVRMEHTGNPPKDTGPGPTIELDPDTWERLDIDLGELAESQRQGYRYLILVNDGLPIHLMVDETIPADAVIEEPALAWPMTTATDVDYVIVYEGGAWRLQGQEFSSLETALFGGDGVKSAFSESAVETRGRSAQRLRLFPARYVAISVGPVTLLCTRQEIRLHPRLQFDHLQPDAADAAAAAWDRAGRSTPLRATSYRIVEGRFV